MHRMSAYLCILATTSSGRYREEECAAADNKRQKSVYNVVDEVDPAFRAGNIARVTATIFDSLDDNCQLERQQNQPEYAQDGHEIRHSWLRGRSWAIRNRICHIRSYGCDDCSEKENIGHVAERCDQDTKDIVES